VYYPSPESVEAIKGLAIPAATAIGCVVGVVGIRRLFDRDRVRLKIRIREFITGDQKVEGANITVINDGYVAVTIANVGFVFPKPGLQIISDMVFPNGEKLPHRLEARASLEVAFPVYPAGIENHPLWRDDKVAFATTACGRTIECKQSPTRK
jgi:hypothetical protein